MSCLRDDSPRPVHTSNQAPSLEKIVVDCARHMKRVGTYHHLTDSMREWFENRDHVMLDHLSSKQAVIPRYAVFIFNPYDRANGFDDLDSIHGTLDEAKAVPFDERYDCRQIVDMQTMQVIDERGG